MWILVTSAVASAAGLGDAVRPTRMAVALDVDPAADTFDGRVSIELTVERAVGSFRLYAEELELARIELARGADRYALDARRLDDATVELVAAAPLARGAWTLDIAYTGRIHSQPYGLYRFIVDEQPYLVTQLEADEARTVWPSFDEPRFKVPHAFEVTAPAGLAVISNGVARQRRTEGDRTVHTFRDTPPMPTYAAALAIGDYVATPVAGASVPVTIWSPRGEAGDRALVGDAILAALPWLEWWFGLRYPYAKLDWILVPSFAFGAMENPAAVVMSAGYLPEIGRGTARQIREIDEVVAHEIAHMWFGNLVTLTWWDDLWLNEAFAEWLGDRFADARQPQLRGEIRRVRQLYDMIHGDGVATERPIRTSVDPRQVFETTNLYAAYRKGSALLDATTALLGEDTLRRGLRRYLRAHAEGNAVAADLFAALTRVSGVDVAAFLSPYLDRAGAPRIEVRAGPDGRVTVAQSRYWRHAQGDGPDEAPWPVHLRLRVGRADGTSRVETRWLRSATADLELGAAAWVLPQADGVGYYTFALDDELLARLLANVAMLSASERMVVLRSLALEAAAGRRTTAQQLELVESFAGERDPAILALLADIVQSVRIVRFAHDPELDRVGDLYVRSRLGPWLDRVGLEPAPGETSDVEDLRRVLLRALALAGDDRVLAYARELTRAALRDPLEVPAERLGWALETSARDGDSTMSDRLLALADATAVPSLRSTLLDAAAAVRDAAVRDRALGRALEADTPYQDVGPLLSGALGATEAHDDAGVERDIAWVLSNADALGRRMPPVHRGRLVTLAKTGCDVRRADEIASFFGDPSRRSAGVDRRVAELLDETRACSAQRAVDLPSVVRFLEAQR
jgi:alanyl aminopeptidase